MKKEILKNKKINKKYFNIILGIFVFISLVVAIQIITLEDGTSSGNITFLDSIVTVPL